jgi:hypothetical protein
MNTDAKDALLLMQSAGTLTMTSWEIKPGDTDEWQRLGLCLGGLHDARQWWIGDWWNAGVALFGAGCEGQMASVVRDASWRGPSYGACCNAARVARAFEFSRRRENLKYTHHEEVSGLPPALQDLLLDRAIKEHASTRTVRKWADEGDPGASIDTKVDAFLLERNPRGTHTAWQLRRTAKVAPDLAQRVLAGELTITHAYNMSVARTREREQEQRERRAAGSKIGKTENVVPIREIRDPAVTLEALRQAMADMRAVCADHYSAETLRRLCAQDVAFQIEGDARIAMRFLNNLAQTWAMPDLRALNPSPKKQEITP